MLTNAVFAKIDGHGDGIVGRNGGIRRYRSATIEQRSLRFDEAIHARIDIGKSKFSERIIIVPPPHSSLSLAQEKQSNPLIPKTNLKPKEVFIFSY